MDDNDAIKLLDEAMQAVEDVLTAMHYDLTNWGNRIQQDRQTLPEYRLEQREVQRTFQTRFFQPLRTVQEVLVHVEFEHTFVIHPENVTRLRNFIQESMIPTGFDEAHPFLITFVSNEQYINIRPGAFVEEIGGYLEDYEGGLYIDQVTAHYKRSQITEFDGSIVARSGEGIPKIIGAYCILDLFPSHKHCVLNTFLFWKYYKMQKLEDLLSNKNKNVFNFARKKILDKLPYLEIHTPSTLQLGYDYDFLVIQQEKDLEAISPQDTCNKCIYYYQNDHVGLVVHREYLRDSTWKKLLRMSEKTCLQQIRRAEPKKKSMKLNVADIECFRERINDKRYVHIALMLGFYDGGQYRCFRGENCLDEFFQYVLLQDRTMQIWFHNGGKYDHHILMDAATRYSDPSKLEPTPFTDLGGRIIRMIVNLKNGRQLIFQDSYALLPSSLDKLAKDFEVTRKMTGVDVDIVNVTKEELLHSPILLEYNRLDCLSLYESLEAYQKSVLEEFGIDPLACVSASSLSKNVYYSIFYQPEVYPLYVFPRKTHQFIERGYQGGRNECFFRGTIKGPLFHYDIKSLFPYAGCMLLPYGMPTYFERLNVTDITSFLIRYPGFYEVTILKTPENTLSLLGVFYDFKYIFPKFENHGGHVFFSAELLEAVQLGYHIKIHCGYSFKLGAYYKDYFEELFAIKEKAEQEGKPALRQAAKITANSGYGLQGFKKYDRRVLRSYGQDYQEYLENMRDLGMLDYAEYNGVFIATQKVDVLLQDVNIAVAAAITSYARLRLYGMMNRVLAAGGHLYYCDTDSIITDYNIEADPVLSDKYMCNGTNQTLGYLVNEVPKGDEIVEAVFIACKTYGYRTRKNLVVAKAKGVHKPENIEDLYQSLQDLLNRPVEFVDTHISTSRDRKIKKGLSVQDELRKKIVSGLYTKGIVNKDGSISPLLLSK